MTLCDRCQECYDDEDGHECPAPYKLDLSDTLEFQGKNHYFLAITIPCLLS